LDRNEFQTRLEMIDVLLKEQGWIVSDRSRILMEVDTKQSDFVAKNYKTVSDTLKNDMESKYADYLLLDSFGAPLAIVEAKRTSKDPRLGQQQAAMYADDIKRQTGKDVFIFLSNGYQLIFWDRERYSPRDVKGFYTQGDLERLRFQKTQDATSPVEVDTAIVDRAKGIECVKRVVEHLQRGHRKGLIVMATGTGKTRVAMAIIKILMEKGLVQKVLFLADRRALRDQACSKGYKLFFPEEAKDKIFAGKYDKSKRLYVSTIQTFQEIYLDKDKNGQFRLSPGEFDLIISDEAHRSIYNKWKDVFTYFDAIQIGLTATPSEILDKDTLRFFECQNGAPTALYSYDDAVAEEHPWRPDAFPDIRGAAAGYIGGRAGETAGAGDRSRRDRFRGHGAGEEGGGEGDVRSDRPRVHGKCPDGPDWDAAGEVDPLCDLEEARVPVAGSLRYALSRAQGHARPDDRVGGFPGGRTDPGLREGIDAPGGDLGGHAGHGY
jgi:type I restriction enzyme R subunit